MAAQEGTSLHLQSLPVCKYTEQKLAVSTKAGVAGGGSAVVTFAPVRELEGVAFAALGLTSMLNSGGAVLECSLRQGTANALPDPSQTSQNGGSQGNGKKLSRGIAGEHWSLMSSCYKVGKPSCYSIEHVMTLQCPR